MDQFEIVSHVFKNEFHVNVLKCSSNNQVFNLVNTSVRCLVLQDI